MVEAPSRAHDRCMSSYESVGDRLVCGVDGSDHSADVVAVASQLAARLGLRLQVVHSAHRDVYVVGEERDALLAAGEALLEDLAPAVEPEDRIVELGDPSHLLHAAIDEGAALAVVGSRGLGAARTALLGSVSHSLASSANCPVVIVPPHPAISLAAHPVVICGVDGSEPSGVALDHAAALASALNGRLTAVNVNTESSYLGAVASWGARAFLPVDYVRAADDALAANRAAHRAVERAAARVDDTTIRLRIEHGDPAVRLRAVAAECASAILVVGSRGHGALRSALLGSVSSRLAAHAPAPVMVVPPGVTTSPASPRPVSSEDEPGPSAANSAAGWQVPMGPGGRR